MNFRLYIDKRQGLYAICLEYKRTFNEPHLSVSEFFNIPKKQYKQILNKYHVKRFLDKTGFIYKKDAHAFLKDIEPYVMSKILMGE